MHEKKNSKEIEEIKKTDLVESQKKESFSAKFEEEEQVMNEIVVVKNEMIDSTL